MDGDQLNPPPPPPEEPAQPARRATGFRKIAATAMLCGGLLVGSGIGGFAIAHAAGNASTPASTNATALAASTTTPAATKAPATKTNCPNMGGSTGSTGSSG
jgi:hypothetical protein